MLATDDAHRLDAAFAALAHPVRRAMLARLVQGEASATDLGEPFSMSQPAVSHHIRVLEDAGLIARRVDGTKRPCRLSPEGVANLDRWLDLLRGALSINYERLDALLAGPDPTET